MKEQLRNFVARLSATLPWINRRTLGALAFAALFIAAMVWLIPTDHPRASAAVYQAATASVTPVSTQPPQQPTDQANPPRRTPLPPEYLNNDQQTVGITYFGAALALVVVVGVLLFMPREER